MITYVYTCLPMFTTAYSCFHVWHLFVLVKQCLPIVTRVYLFTVVYIYLPFLLFFTYVYSCLTVYQCLPVYACMFTYIFTHVYSCLLMFVYSSLSFFTTVYSRLPMFTLITRTCNHRITRLLVFIYVYTCLPTFMPFTRVYLILPLCTSVYMFTDIYP